MKRTTSDLYSRIFNETVQGPVRTFAHRALFAHPQGLDPDIDYVNKHGVAFIWRDIGPVVFALSAAHGYTLDALVFREPRANASVDDALYLLREILTP